MRRLAPLVLALAGCAGEEILHDLEERQANEVLVTLDERGIRATKSREDGGDERWRIEVARRDAPLAHRVLAERDLPRARPPGFSDVFAKASMLPTPAEEHALYLHALAGELSRSVETIEGVIEARVHLGLRQPDPLRPAERSSPRGAVLVKCRAPACGAVRALEPGIRAIVAGGVDGLDVGAVSVVFAEASETGSAPRSGSSAAPALLVGLACAGAIAATVVGIPALRSRLGREHTA